MPFRNPRMAHLQVLSLVLMGSLLVSEVHCKFRGRPDDVPPYKYQAHKEEDVSPDQFPVSQGAIKNYESKFSDEPTAAELYENFNMNTVEGQSHIDFFNNVISPPRVEEVVPGKIYQTLFYALGFPTIYVLPDDTLVWIDAPESARAAQECIDAFRAIPAIGNKPIVALIYTIFHADHIWGAGPIVNDPNNNGNPPVIVAHSNLVEESYRFDTFKSFKNPRLYRMFGPFVPSPPHVHDGGVERIRFDGPFVITHPPTDILYFPDSDTVVSRTFGGLELQFIPVPGYTSDQIIIWVPEWQAMHGSDVFYDSMPNLYTLRGEPGRDVLRWSEGTRKAASYKAQYFTATHGLPRTGVNEINDMLTNYADAIQYIHDQTVRYMAKGYPPDIIPNVVTLPSALAEKDYLRPSYGIVRTAVQGVYDFYVGWFSGFAEDLFPVDRFERGSRLINLVGRSRLQQEAAIAYNSGEYEWALEIATYLWRDDVNDAFALDIRTESMKRLAEVQYSVPSRHYYLSTVMEDWNLVNNSVNTKTSYILLHLDGAMKNLRFHLNSTAAENIYEVLYVDLTDKGIIYKMTIRNSIMYYEIVESAGSDGSTLSIKDTCDLTNPSDVFCWRFMLAGYVPFYAGTISGGTAADVIRFFSYFDFSDEKNTGYSPDD